MKLIMGKKKKISINIDERLLETIKQEAKALGLPYQILMHEVLKKHFGFESFLK